MICIKLYSGRCIQMFQQSTDERRVDVPSINFQSHSYSGRFSPTQFQLYTFVFFVAVIRPLARAPLYLGMFRLAQAANISLESKSCKHYS